MSKPLPTYVPVIIGLILGIIIFVILGNGFVSIDTQTFTQTPTQKIEAELALTKLEMVSNRASQELQMKKLQMEIEYSKMEFELEKMENIILLEKAKVDAEIQRILNTATVESMNDARIDEEIRYKVNFILQLMNQKSTAKHMTTPQIHLNEAQATQKAVQTAIKRAQILREEAKIIAEGRRTQLNLMHQAEVAVDELGYVTLNEAKNKELLSEKIVKETDDLRLKMDIISFRDQVEGQERTIRKLNDRLDREEADNAVLARIIQKKNKPGIFFWLFLVTIGAIGAKLGVKLLSTEPKKQGPHF